MTFYSDKLFLKGRRECASKCHSGVYITLWIQEELLQKNDGLNLESGAFVAQNFSILRRSHFANIVSFFANDIDIRFKDEQVLNKADSILCIFYFHHYVFTLQ